MCHEYDRDTSTNLTVAHALEMSAATSFCNLTYRVIQQKRENTFKNILLS